MLTGDMFLAAAFVCYLGPLTGTYRDELLGRWMTKVMQMGVICSGRFSLARALADPVQVREWQLAGLPTDTVSTDNGILVMQRRQWPLVIDPQVGNTESMPTVLRCVCCVRRVVSFGPATPLTVVS